MNSLWKMNLPWQVSRVITILNDHGYDAYVVGGCVRDALLDKTPHDYDVSTAATPEIVSQCFSEYKVIEVGVLHGTVAVIIDHVVVEITTFRVEGKYRDHRWPTEVSFSTSLLDDMKRRDFTINALAYHPNTGLIDYFGGIDDLQSNMIRAVGDAAERFEEDALRILRCLRFASVLGFVIEEHTANQLTQKRDLLDAIAWERKRDEFMKLLAGDGFSAVIKEYTSVILLVLPELRSLTPESLHAALKSMASVDRIDLLSSLARFVIMLSSMALPIQDCVSLCQRLRFSSQDVKRVSGLIAGLTALQQNEPIQQENVQCKKWLRQFGTQHMDLFLTCAEAMNLVSNNQIQDYRLTVTTILQQQEPFQVRHLAISGTDLQEMGIPIGPKIGQLLEYLLDEVIHDRLINHRDHLLRAVQLTMGGSQ